MQIPTKKLEELFVKPGHIDKKDFEKAVREADRKKILLEEVLIDSGYITDEYFGRTVANGFNWQYVDLKGRQIPEQVISILPEVVARAQRAIVFERDKNVIRLAANNPDDFTLVKDIERKMKQHVEVFYTTNRSLQEGMKFYRGDLQKRVEMLLRDMEEHEDDEARSEQDIVSLVNALIEYAYVNRASDIHLEPLRDSVSVRFRVDGVLHEVIEYPSLLHDKIVLRLKIMARLRTDEHGAAQDGRFDYLVDEISFDVRLSVLPVMYGENVVMRLLAQRARRYPLEALGLQNIDLERVHRAIGRPHGMILSTGPTGSGKTTTLYAMLQKLNEPEVNIMTIEDPVEYSITHIQQTQVNTQKKLTFATGLRAIVRQDPDIIMVGEIRDEDTAAIAINAAMTGHLLLSTLHTNDAATAFPRLEDMGIEPFLISTSLHLIIAQRLVRKICTDCRASYTITKEEVQTIVHNPDLTEVAKQVWQKKDIAKMTLYRGVGCQQCGDAGYSGRTGIFEVLEMDDELRALVTERVSSDTIDKKARSQGMHSMLQDGFYKVAAGITTLDEMLRAMHT